MVRTFLVRGMLVGLLAGIGAFAFGFLVGEASIQQAIDVEAGVGAAHAGDAQAGHGHPGDGQVGATDEPVGRGMQRTAGLLTATTLYGVGMGGMFGLLFAAAAGRMGRVGVRGQSALLAGASFVAVIGVPFLRYPPNPPGVGGSDTIRQRSVLYLVLVVVSVILAVACIRLGRHLAKRMDDWHAALLAAAVFAVSTGVAAGILPALDELPADYPAALLWRFRVASLGTNLVVFVTIGLAFGELTRRSVLRRSRGPAGQKPVTTG